MSKMQDEMRRRTWGAMLQRAFFSVESAIIIAITILFLGIGFQPVSWWESAYWLIFGALAEAVYLGVTLSDPRTAQGALDDMFADQLDPDSIRNPLARDRLKRALEYHRLIKDAAREQGGAMRTHLEATASEVTDWIERIHTLATRLDTFEANTIISRDRRMVPLDLRNLQRQLRAETSPEVRAELEDAIQSKELQLANLQTLENNVRRAEIQLDHTLSALGTVYTQVQIIDSRDVDSARTQRLQVEIRDEVLSLTDTIDAIDEVQRYSAGGSR